MIARLAAVGSLALLYTIVVGSAHLGDVVMALVVSTILLAGFSRDLWGKSSRRSGAVRAVWLLPFLVTATREIVAGSIEVALVVLGLRKVSPGIVRVPIGDRTPLGTAVTAAVMTMSPGTSLIDVDEAEGVMVFHALDASDPKSLRDRQQAIYNRSQQKVFP